MSDYIKRELAISQLAFETDITLEEARDDIARYTEISGEDGEHTSIQRIGAYLDGYDNGYEQGKNDYGKSNDWIPVSERLPEDDKKSSCNSLFHGAGDEVTYRVE